MKVFVIFFLLLGMLLLSACSAPLQTKIGSVDDDGMVYRLPLKAVIVTLTVGSDKKRTTQIAPSAAYPDLSTRLIAEYNNSQLSSDEVSVKTDVSGLLSGDTSATKTSQVHDVLTGLASAVGSLHSARFAGPIPDKIPVDCGSAGTYSWIIEPGDKVRGLDQANADMQGCGIGVKLDILGDQPTDEKSNIKQLKGKGTTVDGLYYRQALPYLVRVTDSHDPKSLQVSATLLALPTRQSPIEFLPVKKTLFAKNTVKFSFTDGSPVLYDQQVDSEWVGLFSLPADIIKSYFAAVGAVFTERQSAMQNEAGYLAEVNALAVQQLKTQACISALMSKDDSKIQTVCGK